MPKMVRVTDANLTWLKENHDTETYIDMAKRLDCCVDTLKRILVREDLQDFDGAKYQVRTKIDPSKMWKRPCMTCGEEEERPRFWYFCNKCRKTMGYTE